MDFAHLITDLDEWLLFIILLAFMILATEIGLIHGRRNGAQFDEPMRTQVITIEAAVLGLFALLLGFTFSMSMIRFDKRTDLVLEEANVLSTAYSRTKLLDEPFKSRAQKKMHHYINKRIDFFKAGFDSKKLHKLEDECARMQNELWEVAVEASQKNSSSIPVGLFTESLNDVMSLDAKRTDALENHVPRGVFFLLYFSGIVTMGLVGYGFGLGGKRNLLAVIVSAILMTTVIILIVDLDRPRRGMIKISQESLMDFSHRLKKYG